MCRPPTSSSSSLRATSRRMTDLSFNDLPVDAIALIWDEVPAEDVWRWEAGGLFLPWAWKRRKLAAALENKASDRLRARPALMFYDSCKETGRWGGGLLFGDVLFE